MMKDDPPASLPMKGTDSLNPHRDLRLDPSGFFQIPSAGFLYVLILVTAVFAAFGQCLFLPFIQDDWGLINAFQHSPGSYLNYATHWFLPQGAFFYRPAGLAVLLAEYRLFGESPVAFHAVALLIHVANAFLVFRIARLLAGDRGIGMLAGLIYAVAAAIHLDLLSWVVAAYDLDATFFFLLSLLLFLHDRIIPSALCFLASVCFKESAVILPFILAALLWLRYQSFSWSVLKAAILRLLPFGAIAGMILVFKLGYGYPMSSLPPSHPYALNFTGKHVFHNASVYVSAMLQSFIPLGTLDSPGIRIALAGIAFFILLAVVVRAFQRTLTLKSVSLGLVLAFWVLMALLPVVFFPNHTFRYYAILALPAFICGILVLSKEVLLLLHIPRPAQWRIMAAAGACVVCLSVVQSNRAYRQGRFQSTLSDYSCKLIARAAVINDVRAALLRQAPHPPDHSVFVFAGIDVWFFEKDSGPQVWYHNPTLRAFSIENLRQDAQGIYLDKPPANQVEQSIGGEEKKTYLVPSLVKVFRRIDSGLQPLSIEELKPVLPAAAAQGNPPPRSRTGGSKDATQVLQSDRETPSRR